MKNLIILLIILLLTGCTTIIELEQFNFGSYNYDFKIVNTGNIEQNCKQIFDWIMEKIYFEDMSRNPDISWIMENKKGDCCSCTFLMIDMLYYFYGYKAKYAQDEKLNHAMVYYNNYIYDITYKHEIIIKKDYPYQLKYHDFDYLNWYWNYFY